MRDGVKTHMIHNGAFVYEHAKLEGERRPMIEGQ